MMAKPEKTQTTKICPNCGLPYHRTIVIDDGVFYVHREGKTTTTYVRRMGYAFKWRTTPVSTTIPPVGCEVTSKGSTANVQEPGARKAARMEKLTTFLIVAAIIIFIVVYNSHC